MGATTWSSPTCPIGARKQHDTLKAYCETHYPEAKNDLANVFLERCLELAQHQGEAWCKS
jgi:hypothetical protein